jgi:hypothetical protein
MANFFSRKKDGGGISFPSHMRISQAGKNEHVKALRLTASENLQNPLKPLKLFGVVVFILYASGIITLDGFM